MSVEVKERKKKNQKKRLRLFVPFFGGLIRSSWGLKKILFLAGQRKGGQRR